MVVNMFLMVLHSNCALNVSRTLYARGETVRVVFLGPCMIFARDVNALFGSNKEAGENKALSQPSPLFWIHQRSSL